MKTIALVLACYSVSLRWLAHLFDALATMSQTVHVYVYAKGKSIPSLPPLPLNVTFVQFTRLPNVGRNDHSFLHHIHARYDSLEDVTLFFKDSSLKDLHVRSTEEKVKVLLGMIVTAETQGYACNPTDYTIGWEEGGNVKDWCIDEWNPSHKQRTSLFIHADPRGLGAWTAKTLTRTPDKSRVMNIVNNPGNTLFCYSGIFAVSRRVLRKTARQTYGRLEKGLTVGDNVEAGHYVERLWGILFR
jgi:hypothetical protein